MESVKQIKGLFKKIPKHIWILFLITAVGIFLRTYNFHDWMRFSMDQSRDAQIISNVIDGKASMPLLGPVAGGTEFHLGPVYYYFSFISAKIFGNYPDKMAYPSLFFAILTIPLFFFLLKEYFSKNISLTLTAILSFSYFFIEDSRFSSNPHLIPFFILLILYVLLKLINENPGKKWQWLSILGISFGIIVQLHTTLLVSMPIFIFIIFIIYDQKKLLNFRQLLFVFLVALFLNTPQFISEYKTGGQNIISFFHAIVDGKSKDDSLFEKTQKTLLCQAKANSNMIYSFPVENECSKQINFNLKDGAKETLKEIKDKSLRKRVYAVSLIGMFLFFICGYFLLIYNLIKEKSKKQKNFLILVTIYNFSILFFLIPVISSISISYFNILFFSPFIFLGLIQNFLFQKVGQIGKILVFFIFMVLFSSIIFFDIKNYFYFKSGFDNNIESSNLKWAEDSGKYILENIADKKIYLSGERKYLNRFEGPLSYMVSREEVEVIEVDASEIDDIIPTGKEFFYLKNFNNEKIKDFIGDYKTLRGEHFSPVDIYILKK